jgi:starch synthase (maltosyl-transferring)
MKRLNRVRRENRALQFMRNVRFVATDNPHLIAYTKETEDGPGGEGEANLVLVVVNLDPFNTQAGWVTLPLHDLGIPDHRPFEVHDQLGGERYFWHGATNYVELNPDVLPAHVFCIYRRHRSEADHEAFA